MCLSVHASLPMSLGKAQRSARTGHASEPPPPLFPLQPRHGPVERSADAPSFTLHFNL